MAAKKTGKTVEQRRIAFLEGKIETLQEELKRSGEKLATKNHDLGETEERAENYYNQLREAESKLRRVENDNHDLKNKVVTLEKRATVAETKLSSSNAALRGLIAGVAPAVG